MLPYEIPRLATDPLLRVFPVVWKLLFFKTPFPGQISVPTSFVSLFIFYILSYLLLKTMGCFSGRLMSSASDQKLFCEVCSAFNCSFDEFLRGESGLPILFLCHLRTAPLSCFQVWNIQNINLLLKEIARAHVFLNPFSCVPQFTPSVVSNYVLYCSLVYHIERIIY